MGICQCKDQDSNTGNMNTKFYANEYDGETKENLTISKSAVKAIETPYLEETQIPSRIEKDPFDENEPVTMSFEQEIDYSNFCKDLFKYLNDLRLDPKAHSSRWDSRLANFYAAMSNKEVKPDYILWSQRLYDACLDKFLALSRKDLRQPLEEIEKKIQEELALIQDEFKYSALIASDYGKYNHQDTLWNLLAKDSAAKTNQIFNDNFCYGAVVSIPLNSKEDRTILIVVQRE